MLATESGPRLLSHRDFTEKKEVSCFVCLIAVKSLSNFEHEARLQIIPERDKRGLYPQSINSDQRTKV